MGKVALGTKARTSMSAHLKTRETGLCPGLKITILGERMTTISWIDLVLDATPVKAIFGQELPMLEDIDLHEIALHRDGPRVLLRFDLQDFPMHPPKKWVAEGFNRVQMRLLASGVRELHIAGWQANNRVDLRIEKDGSLVRIRADNGVVQLDLIADFLIVDRISAYREELSN